jgi:hypothetical protein
MQSLLEAKENDKLVLQFRLIVSWREHGALDEVGTLVNVGSKKKITVADFNTIIESKTEIKQDSQYQHTDFI